MSIASIDLNLLFVLHTVLTERNVARAAERLHVTPSAVSNALARLRDVARGPSRDAQGARHRPHAAGAGAGAGDRARHERARARAPRGAVRGGRAARARSRSPWPTPARSPGLPRIVAAMEREMPRAHLRVIGIDSLVSLGDLASSEIDLQLGVPGVGAGLHVELLYEERMVLVGRRGHPMIGKRLSTARARRPEARARRDGARPKLPRSGRPRLRPRRRPARGGDDRALVRGSGSGRRCERPGDDAAGLVSGSRRAEPPPPHHHRSGAGALGRDGDVLARANPRRRCGGGVSRPRATRGFGGCDLLGPALDPSVGGEPLASRHSLAIPSSHPSLARSLSRRRMSAARAPAHSGMDSVNRAC